MLHLRVGARSQVIVCMAISLLIGGCGSAASTSAGGASDGAGSIGIAGQAVTAYDVTTHLEPLAKAVVAYTGTDYLTSGTDLASIAVLREVEANYAYVLRQEDLWLEYVSGIDFEASGIPDLEPAVGEFNGGLDEWQANQDRGITNWNGCVAAGGGDSQVAACMLSGYSVADEQAALAAYTSPLKGLLTALGVATQ
jgi:hypothetical protein